jgi:phosphoribosylamine--glycine ligase
VVESASEVALLKVLVVGGGGREHALAAALARSPSVERVWCAPGNGGIDRVAATLPDLLATDTEGLLAFARRERIDLTVVGPEGPLAAGIVDRFEAEGLRIFGPRREAARLESSKAFAKALMAKHNIPTAPWKSFDDPEEAAGWCAEADSLPLVVKADGLAAGKGVRICETRSEAVAACREAMEAGRFGEAGKRVVVEEFLRGDEASVQAITDGETLLLLPTAQDHKRLKDGDQGPNTGGMGAYSPAPVAEGATLDRVLHQVLIPLLHGLRREGIVFRGVLYAGVMVTKGGPRVLEFNARFGDPEAEVVLPRIRSDLGVILAAAADGRLSEIPDLEVDPRPCVGVVMASAGYPDAYPAGRAIHGLETAESMEGVEVYHAGTRRRGEDVLTAGGRVLCVSALGEDFRGARDRAYEALGKISFEGAQWRGDIARRAIG